MIGNMHRGLGAASPAEYQARIENVRQRQITEREQNRLAAEQKGTVTKYLPLIVTGVVVIVGAAVLAVRSRGGRK